MADRDYVLKDPKTLLIFSYSPAGFGHLRVTEALYHGLPSGVDPLLLGSRDEQVRFIHRMMSIHPWTRSVMEALQSKKFEDAFAVLYRWFLHRSTKRVYHQMLTLLSEQYDQPRTLVVVATHFGLAHQMGKIKAKLEREKGLKFVLVVQVTDDSPQHMWYVPEADLIFVPSATTQDELIRYGKKMYHHNSPKILVSSYPVSPQFATKMAYWNFKRRVLQLRPETKKPVNVAIPVSGAAVGMEFFESLIDHLTQLSPYFVFHIVVKTTPNTLAFINAMLSKSNVKLYIAKEDRDVVHQYEKLYTKVPIALEVTKPSEQSFKSLLTPKQIGGSLTAATGESEE